MNRWRTASHDLINESDEKRPPSVLGDYAIELITDLYKSGLLVYLNFLGRSDQPPVNDDKVHPPELVELCEKTYSFSLKGSTVCYEQKQMLGHVQSYLNANS